MFLDTPFYAVYTGDSQLRQFKNNKEGKAVIHGVNSAVSMENIMIKIRHLQWFKNLQTSVQLLPDIFSCGGFTEVLTGLPSHVSLCFWAAEQGATVYHSGTSSQYYNTQGSQQMLLGRGSLVPGTNHSSTDTSGNVWTKLQHQPLHLCWLDQYSVLQLIGSGF